MSQPTTNQVFAISGDNPPQTWMSSATYYNSIDNNPAPDQPPPGFWEVDQTTWQDARDAQTREQARAAEQAEYNQRLAQSAQRHALVDAGMTYEVACILVPDPLGDYSIDAWHEAG
jgi:hypothetical protein